MPKVLPISDEIRANVLTIDALYQRVDEMHCTADEVRFTASKDGVPEKVFIDPSRQAADEEFEVNISEFSPLATLTARQTGSRNAGSAGYVCNS